MKQTTLFDLEAFTQSPVTNYDPAWDAIDTPQKNIDTVLEQTSEPSKP
ncbi:hypothetical protein I8752_25010, partial [Nostocaceae cyanobacterium CENA369]|nr:hypothetical protein [Dendronalium phyllosphericum CENA369]